MQSISLGLVGHRAAGERLVRNARFASISSVLATAWLELIGFLSPLRFVLTFSPLRWLLGHSCLKRRVAGRSG